MSRSLRFPRCVMGAVLLVICSVMPTFGQPIQRSPARPLVDPQQEQLKRDADAAYRQGDFERTVALTTQVIDRNTTDHVALYLRGSARVELGIARADGKLLRAGISDAREALRNRSPQITDYYLPYLYGMSHLTQVEQNPSHARTAVDVATRLLEQSALTADNRANLLYQRGLAQRQLNELDRAIADLRQTLDLIPTHLAGHLAHSEALAAAGQVDAAEQALAQIVLRFPDHAVVLNHRGVFFQSQGRSTEAIRDFTSAIEKDSSYVEPYLNRGFALLESNDPEAALGDLNWVIERHPNHIPALSMRGAAQLALGNPSQAIKDYQLALDAGSTAPGTLADLGLAMYFNGDFAQAAQYLAQALESEPGMRFLDPWRFAALKLSGANAAAETAYAPIAEKPSEQRDWFDLLTLSLMGRLDEAELLQAVDSEDASQREAQLCEANYFLGLRRRLDGDPDADTYFRRALESSATRLSAHRGARYALNQFSAKD